MRRKEGLRMIDFNVKLGFICDMDGVIYHGNNLLPHVKDFVEWLKKEDKKFLFLTNNSSSNPARAAARSCCAWGWTWTSSNFYTSALATAQFISTQMPGASAYVVGRSRPAQRAL